MGNCLKSPTSDDISLLPENTSREGTAASDQMIDDALPTIEVSFVLFRITRAIVYLPPPVLKVRHACGHLYQGGRASGREGQLLYNDERSRAKSGSQLMFQ